MARIEQYTPYKKEEGLFNISPSSLYTWVENPRAWKRSDIDGKKFEPNTNTVFGTVVHAGIEQHFKGGKLTKSDVILYLDSLGDSALENIDAWYITDMFEKTIQEAVKHISKPDEMEYQTGFSPTDGFSIGGTADYRRGKVLGDYKTSSSAKSAIGLYYYQLMTLAYCDKQRGIETDTIEVTYIVKPSKGTISEKTGKLIGVKEPKVIIVQHEITEQDWIDIEVFLKEVVKTMKAYQNDNSLADILWREHYGSFIK